MRLLIVHPSAAPRGGIVNATLVHALGLQLRGHRVEVWTASPPLAAACEARAVPVLLHPSMHSPLRLSLSPRVRQRARELRRRGIDAVIHEGAKSWLWAQTSMPRTCHAIVFHNRKLGGRRRFKHWLVLSSRHAADLGANRPVRAGRTIQVIRNGYLPAVGERQGRTGREEPDPSPFRVGVLSGLVHDKGVDLLLGALAALIGQGVAIELVVGGSGPELPTLQALADELGVSGSVHWLGWVEDSARFFAEIDLLCLPSRAESFGLVLVEAMAAGKAVVASRTDGPSDIVAHGETGWLFPIGDSAALAGVLAEAEADPLRRAEVAACGRLRAESRFSPEAAAESIEHALLNILSTSRVAAP